MNKELFEKYFKKYQSQTIDDIESIYWNQILSSKNLPTNKQLIESTKRVCQKLEDYENTLTDDDKANIANATNKLLSKQINIIQFNQYLSDELGFYIPCNDLENLI